MPQTYPTMQEIKNALIERVTTYCHTAGITPRVLCMRAINDPNFFKKLKQGGNFTLRTYHRVNRYIDTHPRKGAKRRLNGHGGDQ